MVLGYGDILNKPELLGKCGGKGKNLFLLKQAGFIVPAFLVIPYETINTQLLGRHKDKIQTIIQKVRNKEDINLASQEIHVELQKLSIDPDWLANLSRHVKDQLRTNSFALRSSVLLEDHKNSSFAGLFHTELNVKAEELEKAISNCILGIFQPQVLAYSLLKGIDPLKNHVALVLQDMVEASVSGICFTMNASGNLNDVHITAGYGSGEGIVNNRTETTSYLIDRQNANICIGKGDPDVISMEQVKEIYQRCMEIEKLFGFPQDIEFSYGNDHQLYILQSRPITTIDIRDLKILDNTNIVESYPGLTLPLSFSFARNGYQQVFTSAARLFSVSEKRITEIRNELSSMIAHIQGRVYYNLHNWYKLMQIVVADENSLHAWETLIGVKSAKKSKIRFSWFNKVRTGFNSFVLFLRYPSIINSYYKAFELEYQSLRTYTDRLNVDKPGPKQVWEFYGLSADKLFKNWAATLLNDFFTFKFFDYLKRMIGAFNLSGSENFSNDLLCGIPGVESERPIMELLKMKEIILGDAGLKTLFQRHETEIMSEIEGEKYPEFRTLVKNYIQAYGDRTLEELKLESPNFRINPLGFYGLLKSQLNNKNTPESFKSRQDAIREHAEKTILDHLRKSPFKKMVFGFVLNKARISIRNRENMRLRRALAYGTVKEIFLYIGGVMHRNNDLQDPADVFYLQVEDLETYSMKEQTDMKAKVVVQKKAYEEYAQSELPDRIVYNDYLPLMLQQGQMLYDKSELRGTGISKGELTAEALVLDRPDLNANADGKILVTKITDPAWVFLMARAGGIITEKGSPLSHTAIVGRELGIPVIIGVNQATSLIKSGEMLHMDAQTGLVKKV